MHVCVKCGAEYSSEDLKHMRACKVCGSTTFLFKSNRKGETPSITTLYTPSDIKVVDDGVFEVNISSLAMKDPVVIEGDEGVFFIKFPKRK